jgi:hypothetical protein
MPGPRMRHNRMTAKALASREPLRYVRASTGSLVEAVEPQIRMLLAEFPDTPTSVIMERVAWERGRTVWGTVTNAAATVASGTWLVG